MSKKQETIEETKNEDVSVKKEKVQSKEKENKKDKKNKKKEKKSGGLGKKTKETMSELKKVTWPKFGKVVKQTGVVISIVLIFAVVLLGIDKLLEFLFGLLIK